MKKPKNKMSIEHRAKQFMPFAALKGFEEALRIKEEEVCLKEEEKKSESQMPHSRLRDKT